MTEPNHHNAIVIPIDLHGVSHNTLETLILIAHRLQRNLVGLLLENEQLQQIADLPFTTEVVLSSGRERGLQRQQLRQQHSAVMEHTRKQLDSLAARDHIVLTYKEARGARLHSALQVSSHADVLFPSRQRWRLTSPGTRLARPIRRLGILLDGTDQNERIISIADSLIRAALVDHIYLLGDSTPSQEQLQKLAHHGSRVSIQSNLAIKPSTLTGLIRNSAYDLLLLPAASLQDIPPTVLDAALEDTTGEVMVVN